MEHKFLRRTLKERSPSLYASFRRSWKIAKREWLPAIPPSEGSFNSQRHFENVEKHLNSLLEPSAKKFQLTPLEIYLLLSSVLFHDFGRVHGDTGHGEASAQELPKNFAVLGIPSLELAWSLSRIALYHDPICPRPGNDDEGAEARVKNAKIALRDVRIEPYGHARELYVGTLLALADHMDGSAGRAVPRYVIEDDIIGFKGAFRRMVSGTQYDIATQCIKTCLSGFHCDKDEDYSERFKPFLWSRGGKSELVQIPKKELDSELQSCELYRELNAAIAERFYKQAKFFNKCLKANDDKPYLLFRNRTTDMTMETTVIKGPWPQDYLLAVVLNDLNANRKFLKQVSGELDEMGLTVENWFVEFGSEVYDDSGKRSSESFLSIELLKAVLKEMWELSCRLLKRGTASYEMLADSMRYENSDVVQLAVKRIALRINDPAKSNEPVIRAGISGWIWKDRNVHPEMVEKMLMRKPQN